MGMTDEAEWPFSYCPSCGARWNIDARENMEVEDDANYCPKCGAEATHALREDTNE